MANLTERLSSFLYKIKVALKFAPLLAVIAATCLYIFNLGNKPYLSVPGSSFKMDLPHFHHCVITFLEPLKIDHYGISGLSDPNASGSTNTIVETQVGAEVMSLLIKNPLSDLEGSAALSSSNQFTVIAYTSSIETHISGISIDGNPVDLKVFFKNNVKSFGARLVRFRYIRKDLAEIIFRLNDAVSNWVLTAMFFTVSWLVIKTAIMEIRAYLYSEERFKRYICSFLGVDDIRDTKHYRGLLDKYIAQWHTTDSRLKFMQALGPAVGFIFTVTSLIEALHPATRSADNLDSFLTGIHVAMISTFLGLLLRLVALEAARVNDLLLDRADSVKFTEKVESLQSEPELQVGT